MALSLASAADSPDDELVLHAQQGDFSAREELFRRHWGIARRVAMRLLGHEQDAEDAVQTGMIKAMVHLQEFDGRSQFRTWLLRIITNSALDSGRRRKRRVALSLTLLDATGIEPSESPDPALGMHRGDLRRALDLALQQLSPTLRTTLVLREEGGLSYQEIADSLNVPIGTVMSRLHEAKRKLQGKLAGWMGSPGESARVGRS